MQQEVIINPTPTYPSINQFRHVVEKVVHRAQYIGQDANDEPMYDRSRPIPTLDFYGTVKLHGTNAGIAFAEDLSITPLSHQRILTPTDDNHGFAAKCLENLADVQRLGSAAWTIARQATDQPILTVVLYGEYCGKGINGKTAIGKLSDRLVLFNLAIVLATGERLWYPVNTLSVVSTICRIQPEWIHFICDYPTYRIEIDFANPESALDELERLTMDVEACCPVATAMGGEPGIGEGIVWTHYMLNGRKYWFKTKGAKHKGTKNARLVQIAPEVLASRQAFVDAVLTEARLEQGLKLITDKYGKVFPDYIGEFLGWIGRDVLKEESDTLKVSGLEKKDVMPALNKTAKDWYLARADRC